MAFDTEKFIVDLAKQLNLRNMDDAQRARLADLKKKGVATGKQKKWDPTALPPEINAITPADPTTTPPTPETFTYTGEDTATHPVPTSDSLQDLYLKLVVILRDVNADKDLRENDPTKKFLETFYGAGKAIEQYVSKPVPATYPVADIANYIAINKAQLFLALGINESDLEKLANALNDGSYTTNAKALGIFEKFLIKLSNHYYSGGATLPGTIPPGLQHPDQISDIYQAITTPEDPTPAQLSQLMAGKEDLFGKLIANEKLREKVLAKDTNGDITTWINKGLNETNYNDGDHKLNPLYEDRKTLFERAKDNLKKKYEDTLGKLEQKHKRHIYSTNARYIVEQLIKKNVDPTSGMEKLYDTLGAVKANLPNPVQKQLDWVIKTLGKVSDKTFFKEALSNGNQMRQLVQEIVKAAVHDDKKEEAKVALEMLSVMRYTMTTSSVRANLKKTEFTIFSDSSLSINKNGGEMVQAFTKATDKLIKTMTMGVFELGNLAKNAIKTNGVKFGHGTGRLDKRTTDSVEYTDPDKKKTMEELYAWWDFFNSSDQSKDYNILASHKGKQKAADDAGTPGTVSITTAAGDTYSIDDPTNQQERFLEFLRQNNIGRAA